MRYKGRTPIVMLSVLAALILISTTVFAGNGGSNWLSSGHDLQNTRYQDAENKIEVSNVARLAAKWVLNTEGDVSATPAVSGKMLYVPDTAGNLFAINNETGATVWSHKFSDYTGVPGNYSRTTPAVVGNLLILGDQGGKFGAGASVLAVDISTGNLVWKTKVDDHFSAIVTQSAVVDISQSLQIAYVGVSSSEEAFAAFIPNYPCCSFRGSMLAINAATGQILWKTYIVPDGYSGGAVWGSTPVIDHSRNSLYISTGNNYSVPQTVLDCVSAAAGNATAEQACISPDDHFDSVMALDLSTGAIKWASTALPFDAWNVACIPGFDTSGNCPEPAGPDYDFGQGPALFSVKFTGGKTRDLLGVGQKSGQYWAFDPSSGAVVWVTQAAPGGTAGGLQWGSAVDGSQIYVASANSLAKSWELIQNGVPSGVTTTGGTWSALDAATGKILWQTADPLGFGDTGAVSGANGVIYGCSLDPQGHMYALNAKTGAILWDFASGGSCGAGAAISNGVVYWGSGYSLFGTTNNKLYAFATN